MPSTVEKISATNCKTAKINCILFIFFFLEKQESMNEVLHYHKLCSRVSHTWGNHRGQHIGVRWISLTLGTPPS